MILYYCIQPIDGDTVSVHRVWSFTSQRRVRVKFESCEKLHLSTFITFRAPARVRAIHMKQIQTMAAVLEAGVGFYIYIIF